MTLDEIIDKQNAINAELERMDADPDTTEERDGNLRDTLIKEWKQLDELRKPLVARMEDLQLIRRASADRANTESGDGGGSPWSDRRAPEFMQRRDPFADLPMVEQHLVSRSEMIDRAVTATENSARRGVMSDAWAQEATRKAQSSPWIARHMLLYGSDDYVETFRAYLNNPNELSRTPLALATANGGVMLPYQLDPTIVLTNDGSANPFRRLSNVKTTTTNNWHGVSSAGVTAAWLDEATAASDKTPTFGSVVVYPKKAAAWIYGSFEVLEDTNFGDQLPRLLADAKDRLEEAAFAAGTGANTDNTGAPAGVVNALGTATRMMATNTTGGAFVQGTAGQTDILGLQAKLAPRWRMSQSAAYVANLTNINKLRAVDQYGGGGFWTNLNAGTPSQILGQRIEESSSITVSTGTGATTAYAAAVYGDWSQFYIVDRIGTQMLYEPLVKATSVIGAPTGQSGWFMFWRVGSAVANAGSFAWMLNGTA